MSAFRTFRPLLVDARQCECAETVVTNCGVLEIAKGDWLVRGENGETYAVDHAFFQRTFMPFSTLAEVMHNEEGRHYGC